MTRRLLDVSSGTRLLSCVIICGIIARPLRMMIKRNQRYSMKNDKLKLEYAIRGECRNTTSEWRQACNQLRDLPKISQLVVAIDFNGGRNWSLMISYMEQDLTGKSSMFGHQSMEAQNYIALSELKNRVPFQFDPS
jgi:hypothetical protein